MKIIKYSADNLSSGSLCGLDVDACLQLTHCFPVVDEADNKLESHQLGMLRSLREVRSCTRVCASSCAAARVHVYSGRTAALPHARGGTRLHRVSCPPAHAVNASLLSLRLLAGER